ncbi:MAG TPA: hypothetical protein VLH75_01055 [Longimicrobiales bacterium]|nr:hypothetical protein [Longimicrobiales bacterium]
MSARRRLASGLALSAALALAACDSGPEGPGVLAAKVTSPQPLGAVVLEFTGAGITGFEARGTTQVFGAVGGAGSQRHRVILVSPAGTTEIPFGIAFQDRAGELPSVVAITASSPSNANASAAGLKVRIER